MSPYVDWEEDNLFYAPIDYMIEFCVRKLSRNVVLRHDYNLHEFTLYIYKEDKK